MFLKVPVTGDQTAACVMFIWFGIRMQWKRQEVSVGGAVHSADASYMVYRWVITFS